MFLAHLSLWAYWCAYSIGRPLSSVRMYVCVLSTFSNIFSSETTGAWDGGTKVCSKGPGHMTKDGRHAHIW